MPKGLTLSDWLDQAYQQCEEHVFAGPEIGLRFRRDVIGWLRDEVKILEDNQISKTICSQCKGTGLVDSGGFNPQGHGIDIECQCGSSHIKAETGEMIRVGIVTTCGACEVDFHINEVIGEINYECPACGYDNARA